VTALSFPDASFDVVVSFETIEHIPDDEAYLDEMRRVCRPGGLFLCSTPNRKVMNPGRGIEDGSFNPHHVREYDAAQLSERLARRFRDVQLLGQSSYPPAYVRTLEWVARGSRAAAARAHQAAKVLTAPFTPGERHIVRPVAPLSCPEMLVALARP
jgi:SAM-dependent methyltransferase